MRIPRKFQEETDMVPLTPLIDIVFLTLIFFMVTTMYNSLESEVDITLPTASTGAQNPRTQGEIYINVRSDGSIVVNERQMELPELQQVLNRIAEYFPGGSVIIRGDRAAMLGRAIEVLDCCRKADIQNVGFSTLPEPEE